MDKHDWKKFLLFWLGMAVAVLLVSGLEHLLRELSGWK